MKNISQINETFSKLNDAWNTYLTQDGNASKNAFNAFRRWEAKLRKLGIAEIVQNDKRVWVAK
jgi:hypothetical protein